MERCSVGWPARRWARLDQIAVAPLVTLFPLAMF
jgi:hypothetical protein